jgi:LacI family transcriptional regulator
MNLKQLADMLQLSQTTVSRALNGYPEVKESTRRRIMEAAKRHGYRPNPSARRLATGRSGMIGYVMPTGSSVDIDPHFIEFLSGLGDYARAHDLDLVLSPTSADEEATTYRRIVGNGQVDAIYVSAPKPRDRRIALLEELGIAYIVHGRADGLDFSYPYLDIDNEGAFHDAGKLLLQMGHRRIALLNGDPGFSFAIHRERGLRRAMEERGLTLPPSSIHSMAMTEENGYRSMRALLDLAERPTAVICSSLLMSLGASRALRDAGLTMPDDMSVISHDDVFPYLRPESFPVPLTTTRSSIRLAGQRIAERLALKLAEIDVEVEQEVWPVELIMRGSVSTAPA